MSELVKNGVVRLYLEVRYDMPFSLDEPTPVEEIIKKIMDSTDLCETVGSTQGEWAEEIHGIMVDVTGEQGEYEHTAALYETPEEVDVILNKIANPKEQPQIVGQAFQSADTQSKKTPPRQASPATPQEGKEERQCQKTLNSNTN